MLLFICVCIFTVTSSEVEAATTTVKIYAASGDGYVDPVYPGSWATQHADTTGRAIDYTSDISMARSAASGDYNTGYLTITKSFAGFDTSVIPDDAEIIDASLNLNINDTMDHYNDAYSYITVLEGFQSSVSSLTGSDFAACGDATTNPTKGSNDVDITGITINQYQPFDLNSTGKSWIDKEGYTKLCLREGHDIENIPVTNPTATPWWKESRIKFDTSEKTGTTTDPYLEVTYVD